MIFKVFSNLNHSMIPWFHIQYLRKHLLSKADGWLETLGIIQQFSQQCSPHMAYRTPQPRCGNKSSISPGGCWKQVPWLHCFSMPSHLRHKPVQTLRITWAREWLRHCPQKLQRGTESTPELTCSSCNLFGLHVSCSLCYILQCFTGAPNYVRNFALSWVCAAAPTGCGQTERQFFFSKQSQGGLNPYISIFVM